MAFGFFVHRHRIALHVAIAVVLLGVGTWNLLGREFAGGISNANFDLLMNKRFIPYKADPDIVILDIDEGSLKAMAPRYGLWPWPRELLAEVASRMEGAGAKAVLFDILFVDPDTARTNSEVRFLEYVSASKISYFPFVRRDRSGDAASPITLSMLNFVAPDPAWASRDPMATIALSAPFYAAITDSGRLGYVNASPDRDNVVRSYDSYELKAGYRIPSLPYRAAQALRWPRSYAARSLINWPKDPAAEYRAYPFSEALSAARRQDNRFFERFRGKIVLVGSTAFTLNDIKSTPVDSALPGLYILAVAADNLKNGAFLKPLPRWGIWLCELLVIAMAYWLCGRLNKRTSLVQYLFLIPTLLLGISLVSISISHVYMDLTMPAGLGISFFGIAQLIDKTGYSFATASDAFALKPEELSGRDIAVAVLPNTVSKAQILDYIRRDSRVRLWEVPRGGFAQFWLDGVWMLWRFDEREGSSHAENGSKQIENRDCGIDSLIDWVPFRSEKECDNDSGLEAAIFKARSAVEGVIKRTAGGA